MLSIQFLLLIGLLFVISYLVGRIVQIAEMPGFFPELMLTGFIVTLGSFQLISTPLMGFHAPFSFALIAFWLLIGCFGCVSILQARNKPDLFRIPRLQIEGNKIIFWAAIVLVLAQAIIVSVFHFENPDDSFYVSSILTTIDSPAIYSIDPSTGDPNFPLMAQYRFESWELLQSVLSKSFSIAPAILAHTILPFGLVVLAYLSYSILAKELLPSKYIPGFILSLSIFHLFSGYSEYSAGTFLLTRIWQGKSVLLHIGIPYLIAVLLQWFKSNYDPRHIWKVVAIILFSISLNPIAIFLPPLIIAAFMGIGLILHFRKRKDILLMGISIIPLALYALAIRSGMVSSIINQYPLEEFSLRITLNRFMGAGYYFYIALSGWDRLACTSSSFTSQNCFHFYAVGFPGNCVESIINEYHREVSHQLPDLLAGILALPSWDWISVFYSGSIPIQKIVWHSIFGDIDYCCRFQPDFRLADPDIPGKPIKNTCRTY